MVTHKHHMMPLFALGAGSLQDRLQRYHRHHDASQGWHGRRVARALRELSGFHNEALLANRPALLSAIRGFPQNHVINPSHAQAALALWPKARILGSGEHMRPRVWQSAPSPTASRIHNGDGCCSIHA
jgi:hypothetical protein